MSRKKHNDPNELTMIRLAELRGILTASDRFDLGPQDQVDLIQVIDELAAFRVERRNAERSAA